MPEARNPVLLILRFASYNLLFLSILISLTSGPEGTRVCVATYGDRCMLFMDPFQGIPCPPDRHTPCCMSRY